MALQKEQEVNQSKLGAAQAKLVTKDEELSCLVREKLVLKEQISQEKQLLQDQLHKHQVRAQTRWGGGLIRLVLAKNDG